MPNQRTHIDLAQARLNLRPSAAMPLCSERHVNADGERMHDMARLPTP